MEKPLCQLSVLLIAILLFLCSSFACAEPIVTSKVYLDVTIDAVPVGRITIGLFGNEVPKTVENFRQLITGQPGFGYKDTIFHYVHPLYFVQGGDVTKAKGRGGYSIYGSTFPDENFSVTHFAGAVGMSNKGKDTNNSQFYITSEATPWLDNKNVVFGKVLDGMDTVNLMQGVEKNEITGRPAEEIRIVNCGILE